MNLDAVRDWIGILLVCVVAEQARASTGRESLVNTCCRDFSMGGKQLLG